MTQLQTAHCRRGFTISDLGAVLFLLAFVAVLVGILLPARGHGCGGKQIKCAAQLRETHKGMVMWAQQNNDWFPLASKIGRDGATINAPDSPSEMDATATVYSIMIYNSLVTPDVLYSPAEASGQIAADHDYEYTEPTAAIDPLRARWDPSYRGTPMDGSRLHPGGDDRSDPEIGNASYAHLALAGLGRSGEWKNTLSSNYAALGNRGPEETGGNWHARTGRITETTLAKGLTGKKSLTLLIHGSKKKWEGNIAYNDNHVNFETSTYPDGMLYTTGDDEQTQRFGDGLFLDEGDPSVLSGGALEDTIDSNCYLGMFRRGPTEAERREHEQTVKFITQARWFDGMTP